MIPHQKIAHIRIVEDKRKIRKGGVRDSTTSTPKNCGHDGRSEEASLKEDAGETHLIVAMVARTFGSVPKNMEAQ